jgi:transcriptional regulator with PAS, ATPase and Fis domain
LTPATTLHQRRHAQAVSRQPLDELERRHILAALERHHGNRTAAAQELGISRRTMHYRLRDYAQRGLLPRGT